MDLYKVISRHRYKDSDTIIKCKTYCHFNTYEEAEDYAQYIDKAIQGHGTATVTIVPLLEVKDQDDYKFRL